MKILYYDCFCGISGDMNLGALIDLGVDKDYLNNELSKLNLNSEFQLEVRKAVKKNISGTKVDVILINEQEHVHRHLTDVENIINKSSLNEKVKKLSLNIFMKIAEAEAKVHNKSIYEVSFHEVGAVDSIIDIVGAAIALDYLKVDKIAASPVQVGGGFVKCAHGVIPVPAPATVEILKGVPIKSGIVPFETTTPTGAAILAANVQEFTDKMEFIIEKTGYGIGNKDFEIPNVLRVYLGNSQRYENIEEQYIIETNIDDMNAEILSYAEEKLFEKGALDVFKTPIIMKKGRAATKLSVLFSEEKEKDMLQVIFRETTAIGVRKYKVEKIMLKREFTKLNTKYGEVTIKNSYFHGELVNSKAEYEQCKSIAIENNISLEKVYREINKAIQENIYGGR